MQKRMFEVVGAGALALMLAALVAVGNRPNSHDGQAVKKAPVEGQPAPEIEPKLECALFGGLLQAAGLSRCWAC